MDNQTAHSKRALEMAQNLVPVIEEQRDETEAGRRIAKPIVDRLIEARLGRMAVVEELGGLEMPTPDALRVYETLAGAEASVSWVTWNMSLPCLFSRFLTPEARSEIFADPDWLYANSTRPSGKATPVDGGYRASGRWSLVSGCELAEWLALMCVVMENGKPRMLAPGMPEMRFMFVRNGDFEILDTWYVGGLRGTGSHDVVLDDQFVPTNHSMSPADPPTIDRPIGRVPIICTLSTGFAAQTLGIAARAIETVTELGRTKVTPEPVPDLRDRPGAQFAIAARSAEIAAARDYLYDRVGMLWEKAVAGDEITNEDRGTVFGASLQASRAARAAVDEMYEVGGTTSIYTDCPLERAHRDIHAMLRHVLAQPLWLEDAGRVMFGLDPASPLFAV